MCDNLTGVCTCGTLSHHGHDHSEGHAHLPFHNLFGTVHESYFSQFADAPALVGDDEATALARYEATKSPTPENLLTLAGALCFQLRYKDAAEVYRRILRDAPDNYAAKRKLALCMLKTRDFATARKLLADCDAANPDSLDVVYRQGLCEFYDGDFERAAHYFEKCYPLSEDNGDMYIATIYWHALSLVRCNGNVAEAMNRYNPDIKIGHHLGYLLTCKLFSGEDTLANLTETTAHADEMTRTILLYGVYHFEKMRAKRTAARAALSEMLSLDTYWGSFAWIAAYGDGIAEGVIPDLAAVSETLKNRLASYGEKGVAIAYSGGTDSACLAAYARLADIPAKAYLVCSALRSEKSLEDAEELAYVVGINTEKIKINVLSDENIIENSVLRCYYCKRALLSAVIEQAKKDGFDTVVDGTNASDDSAEREGMRALSELGVRSPFRECGIDKKTVRLLARAAGLSVWDKPSDSCLATRIATGERLTAELLGKVERAEEKVAEAGLSGFRVKVKDNRATLLIREEDEKKAEEAGKELLDDIYEIFDGGYPSTGRRRSI